MTGFLRAHILLVPRTRDRELVGPIESTKAECQVSNPHRFMIHIIEVHNFCC